MPESLRTARESERQSFIVEVDGTPTAIGIPTFYVEQWDKKYGAGKFQLLLDLLSVPCNSFAWVGTQFLNRGRPLSRERIRQLYNRYFGAHTTKKGHARRSECTIQSMFRNAKYPKHVLDVWRAARAQGLNVSPIVRALQRQGTTARYYVAKNTLSIEGISCDIHKSTSPHYVNKECPTVLYYCSTFFKIRKVGCTIFVCPVGLFVLPPDIKRGGKKLVISIRADGTPSTWEPYRNAWHWFRGNPIVDELEVVG